MATVSELIGMLTAANVNAGEYIAGTIEARVITDQCSGVINEAQRVTAAAMGETQSQTLSDAVGALNTAESKVRFATEVLTEGMEAAHQAISLNTEYIARLTS